MLRGKETIMPLLIVPIGLAGSGKSTAATIIAEIASERGLVATEAAFATPIKSFCRSLFGFSQENVYGPSAAREEEMELYKNLQAWDGARDYLRVMGNNFIDECWPDATPEFWLRARRALDDWFNNLMAESPWHWEVINRRRQLQRRHGLSARRALQTLGTEWGRSLDADVWIDCLKRSVATSPANVVVLSDARFFNEAEKSGGFPLLIRRPNLVSTTPSHASERDQQTPEMLAFCARNGAVINNTGSLQDLRKTLNTVLGRVL